MASKVFINFLMIFCSDFLDLAMLRSLYNVIENQTFVTFAHLFTISDKQYQLRPRNVVKLQ